MSIMIAIFKRLVRAMIEVETWIYRHSWARVMALRLDPDRLKTGALAPVLAPVLVRDGMRLLNKANDAALSAFTKMSL